MSKLEEILSRLENVKKSGSGYRALCPAHDDKNPSLSITEKDGKILIHCFAGCSLDDILAGMEMDKHALFVDTPKTQQRVVATYNYQDEAGKVLFRKIRFEPKDFQCRLPDGSYKLNGTRRVLYNLPAVIESPIVFIPEGEKDVETLRKYGYVGTCNYDGASQNTQKPKWKTDYNPFFDGKVVYILPDNDPPGRAHAANIFRNIHSLTRQCRIVELPGLKPGGDITDYFRNGGTVDTFNDICLNAPEGIPAGWEAGKEPSPERRLKFTCFSDIQEERLDWLWPNRIPKGMLSMIVGNPNAGKTFVTCSIISTITTGRDWPDCPNDQRLGRVLFFGEEDSFATIMKPRIRANGGDCRLLHGFDCVQEPGKEDQFNVTEHIDLLEQAIDGFGDVALIVFDPITAYLRGINANDNAEVRSAMIGLQRLAQKKGVTLLGLSHFSKKCDIDAIHRIIGSTAFVAAARSVWAVIHEKNDTVDRRVFLPVKSNYSIDVQGLAFNIIEGAVGWQSEAVEQDVNSIMRGGRVAAEKDKVKDWLKQRLGKDTVLASEIIAEGRESGFSAPTIQRAATELGVTKRRSKLEQNRSVWSLSGQKDY